MEKSPQKRTRHRMLRRALTALVMAAIAIPAVIFGGVFYFVLFTVVLAGAAWEFARLYRAVKFEPHEIVTVAGVLVIATARFFFAQAADAALVFFVLLAMAVHLFAFERGRDQAAADFAITVAGIVYIGWVGSYL